MRRVLAKKIIWVGFGLLIVLGDIFSLPSLVTYTVEYERARAFSNMPGEGSTPVTAAPVRSRSAMA